MKAEVLLEIPNDVAGRIATGELERVGGVVRDRSSGKVVMWLRETTASPMNPEQFPMTKLNELLRIGGHSASILNLGATVAFGVATLKKLSRIEGKIDVMNSKLDELNQKMQKLQWTVELGFANTLQALEGIKQYQEVELAGELNSAASLAWSCQFLEPNSNQRMTRIENALHTASNVKEKLLIHAQQEVSRATEKILERRKTDCGFSFEDEIVISMFRLRQAVAATALCASISAESDDLYTAGSKLGKELELLGNLHLALGQAALNSDEKVYRVLLSAEFSDLMPVTRIDSWSKRYDKNENGLFGAMDLFRRNTESPAPQFGAFWGGGGLYGRRIADNAINANTSKFVDLLDGIDSDINRLCGYQAEYKVGSDLGLNIQQYRDLFRIDEVPDRDAILFLAVSSENS